MLGTRYMNSVDGVVFFDRELDIYDKTCIIITLGLHDDEYEYRSRSLYINKYAGVCDWEKALEALVIYCRETNINIGENSSFKFNGDAEGAFLYRGGKFVEVSMEDYYIQRISDEKLLAEIMRRGLTPRDRENEICHETGSKIR